MFGLESRLRKLIGAAAVAASLGLTFAGCGGKPEPTVVEPTKEQQAQEKVAAAQEAVKAGDLAKAASLAEEANVLNAGSGKAVLEQIQAEREAQAHREREQKIQAALAEAKSLLAAGSLDQAKAKAQEVLREDANNAEARQIVAKADEAAKGPATKEQYDAVSAQVNAAVEAGQFDKAVSLIRELEQYVDEANGLASRRGEVAGLEARKLVAEGDAAVGQRQWVQAVQKFEAAVAVENVPQAVRASATQKLQAARTQQQQVEQAAAQRRQFQQELDAGRRMVNAGQAQAALKSLQNAERVAPDAASRSRVQAEIAVVRREIQYQEALASANQALANKDYDAAVAAFEQAQGFKASTDVASKLQEARALKAEFVGDAALEEGDFATALAQFETAKSIRPTPELEGKLEVVMAQKERSDYLTMVAEFEVAREELRFAAVAAQAKQLAEQYPQWDEAKQLVAQGPLQDEVKALAEQADLAWRELQVALRALGRDEYTQRIELIEAAQPKLAYSRYEANAAQLLTQQRDALKLGLFQQVSQNAKQLEGQEKIDFLQGQLPEFAGTSHAANVEKMIFDTKTQMKKDDFNALRQGVARMQSAKEKHEALLARAPEYEGTSFASDIAAMIERELNTIKADEFAALRQTVAQLESAEAKLAELTKQLGSFAGSRYEVQVQRMIDAEKATIATQKYNELRQELAQMEDPNQRIQRLEAAVNEFAGTRYDRTVDGMLGSERTNLVANIYNQVTKAAAGLELAERVTFLQENAAQFQGTRYERGVAGLLERAQRDLATQLQRQREAAASEAYNAAMAQIRGSVDYAANLQALTGIVETVEGTRLMKRLQAEIDRQQQQLQAQQEAQQEVQVEETADDQG